MTFDLMRFNTICCGKINVRGNRQDNQRYTIQRNWQYWVHKTKQITEKTKTWDITIRKHT